VEVKKYRYQAVKQNLYIVFAKHHKLLQVVQLTVSSRVFSWTKKGRCTWLSLGL